jgi:hypothetical protein
MTEAEKLRAACLVREYLSELESWNVPSLKESEINRLTAEWIRCARLEHGDRIVALATEVLREINDEYEQEQRG